MSNETKNSTLAKFTLTIGTRAVPLELGAVLKGDAIGQGERDALIGRVDPGKEGAEGGEKR